jgi:FkbM family methyltransferase
MTQLNLEWVKENFNKENLIVFDIGAADMEVSRTIRHSIPTAKLYAFEAFDYWHAKNQKTALQLDINYFKVAVCDTDGTTIFHPCLTEGGKDHPFSGSIFRPMDFHTKHHQQVYGDPVTIDSIRLETFCKEHNITPDFIHIDVEGAELKVFQNIGEYKPKCIWAEIGAFQCYDSNTSVYEFNQLMTNMGYYMVYGPPDNNSDALYCLSDFKITPYIPKKP